jgi:hypothetical protein
MAGPAASVLTPKSLSPLDVRDVLQSVPGELVPTGAEPDDSRRWVFTMVVNDPASGGPPSECLCSFDVQLDDLRTAGEFGFGFRSEEDFRAVKAALGWAPVSEVTFAAFRNSSTDHSALAALAALVADQVGGVIDLNGNLPLPAPLRSTELASRRIVEVTYEINGGRIGVVQIATPAFLREWVKHQRFLMVK